MNTHTAIAGAHLDGIVLAGGRGSRMGRPKATVRVGGRTLVEHAVDVLSRRCRRVIVVTRPGVTLPHLDATVVADRPGPAGPLTGMATGLDEATSDDVIVVACDLPFMAPMVDALCAAAPGEPAVGRDGGRIQPLCARSPRLPALRVAEGLLTRGESAARGPALALRAREVDDLWGALANLNTPADLEQARQRVPQAGWSPP